MNRMGYFIVGAVAGAAGLLVSAYFKNGSIGLGAKEDVEIDNLSETGSDTASQSAEATGTFDDRLNSIHCLFKNLKRMVKNSH